MAPPLETLHVHFQGTLYEVQEQLILQNQIESNFHMQDHESNSLDPSETTTNLFDCSNIRFTGTIRFGNYPGFCLDIGAQRSVVGQYQLNTIIHF